MNRIAALIFACLALASRGNADEAQSFHVQFVEGPVSVRLPFEQVWRPVRLGRDLPRGALLQVGDGGRIGFDYLGAGGAGLSGARTSIKITVPIVARVGDDLLRKVKVTSKLLNRIENDPVEKAEADAIEVGWLGEAWEKVVAMVRVKAEGSQEAKTGGIEEQLKTGKIEFLRPTPDAEIAAETPAAGVLFVWRAAEGDVSYDLKVWPHGSPQPAVPTAQTTDTEFLVRPSRFGLYDAVVVTPDGKWQSKTITFNLVRPNEAVTASGDAGSDKRPQTGIELRQPPDNFTISGAKTPYALDLAWTDPGGAAAATVYEVIVRDEEDVVRSRLRTADGFATIDVPQAGSYKWQVKGVGAHVARGKRRIATSSLRHFIIEPTAAAERLPSLTQRLQTLLASPGSKIVHFERGL